jgi:hypothetical protein
MDVKIFSKGKTVWKGFSGEYNTNILKNEKYFYVSGPKEIAKTYRYLGLFPNMSKSHVCQYVLTRRLRLLNMTPKSVSTVLKLLDENSREHKSIRFAFVRGNRNAKNALLQQVVGPKTYAHFKSYVPANSKRLSLRPTDTHASRALCAIMQQYDFDGYYFDGDETFHKEIMICDASKKLLQMRCQEFFGKPRTRFTNERHVTFVKNVLNDPKVTLANLEKLEKIPGIKQVLDNKRRNLTKVPKYRMLINFLKKRFTKPVN